MSYLEKLKSKTSPLEELPKVPKGVETENKATPPTAKSAKRPFDSFDSTPGRRFFKIQKMTKCLHQKRCRHLISEPPERPYCAVNDIPVFDLEQCPLRLWFNV